MDLHLKGKAFLVTGGSRGLGFATARVLTEEGARVVLSGRDETSLDKAVAELGAESAIGVVADNADPVAASQLVAATMAAYGRIDGATISVGGPPPGPIMKMNDDQWRSAFESVFLGAVRIAKEVAAATTEGGSILFVLSSTVRSPIHELAISNGLRPGLAMVAKSMADELGPKGIRVNGILPGRIETDRTKEVDQASDPSARKERLAEIPLQRYGDPLEFGRVATVLLSPVSSYVTGSMIQVDGGALRTL